ncbi:MAG: TssQ family T6SS-associated lipoprotein [Betaproteobacteria bacterium]
MLRLMSCVFALAMAIALGGCQSKMVQEFPLTHFTAESLLDAGIRQYDEGDYKAAARNVQAALDQGLTTASQARAHKYLAFIHCVSSEQPRCRDEFRKALEIAPNLELRPEEAGHPIWGPIFRSTKSAMSAK